MSGTTPHHPDSIGVAASLLGMTDWDHLRVLQNQVDTELGLRHSIRGLTPNNLNFARIV